MASAFPLPSTPDRDPPPRRRRGAHALVGRLSAGRVLAGLAGKEINTEAVRDGCTFLCGACSCLVKRLNPGTDLLLAADWEGLLQEKEPKEPVPAPTAADVVPIPHPPEFDAAEMV